ncbi:MAG UNVERIFIED_CONTAM: hypothetical protein LVR18_43010 [Planctomycetaceae bacterium]
MNRFLWIGVSAIVCCRRILGMTAAAQVESDEKAAAGANSTGWNETPAAPRGWLRWSPLLVVAGLCVWLASVFTDSRLLRPPVAVVAVPGADQPAPPAPPAPPAAGRPCRRFLLRLRQRLSLPGRAEPVAVAEPAAVAANGSSCECTGKSAGQSPADPLPPAAAVQPVPAEAAAEPAVAFNVLLQCDDRTPLLANEKTGAWGTLLQIPGGDTVTTAPISPTVHRC